MDVKVRCKDDKYTRHYKADKVLYSGNGLPGKNGKGNP